MEESVSWSLVPNHSHSPHSRFPIPDSLVRLERLDPNAAAPLIPTIPIAHPLSPSTLTSTQLPHQRLSGRVHHSGASISALIDEARLMS